MSLAAHDLELATIQAEASHEPTYFYRPNFSDQSTTDKDNKSSLNRESRDSDIKDKDLSSPGSPFSYGRDSVNPMKAKDKPVVQNYHT